MRYGVTAGDVGAGLAARRFLKRGACPVKEELLRSSFRPLKALGRRLALAVPKIASAPDFLTPWGVEGLLY